MCENNYGYMVPCHQNHNLHPHHQHHHLHHHPTGPGGAMATAAAATPYEDEDYYAGTWTNAEYVPNNSDQCQLE